MKYRKLRIEKNKILESGKCFKFQSRITGETVIIIWFLKYILFETKDGFRTKMQIVDSETTENIITLVSKSLLYRDIRVTISKDSASVSIRNDNATFFDVL